MENLVECSGIKYLQRIFNVGLLVLVTDGHVRIFQFRSFILHGSLICAFFAFKIMTWFQIIFHFPSISFVFSLNDCSVKSFFQWNQSFSKKNNFFWILCSKKSLVQESSDKSSGKFVRSVKNDSVFKFVQTISNSSFFSFVLENENFSFLWTIHFVHPSFVFFP